MSNGFTTSRRGFLKAAALPIAAPFISRHSWAEGSPMQKLQYAAIGAGSRGASDINSITRHKQIHMLAAADVDLAPLSKVKEKHTDLATFQDWREMLTSHSEQIDVVSVSTPDHMHGIQAISAMNLGMHAYVQKPLAQSIGECRAMQEAAVRNQVVVQMGTQLASGSHDRMAVALVQQRLIGEIQEAWVFCGKGKRLLPYHESGRQKDILVAESIRSLHQVSAMFEAASEFPVGNSKKLVVVSTESGKPRDFDLPFRSSNPERRTEGLRHENAFRVNSGIKQETTISVPAISSISCASDRGIEPVLSTSFRLPDPFLPRGDSMKGFRNSSFSSSGLTYRIAPDTTGFTLSPYPVYSLLSRIKHLQPLTQEQPSCPTI